jgi:signal peptidase II
MNETPSDERPDRARRRLLTMLVGVALTVIATDQLTKVWAVAELSGRGRVDLIGDLLGLRLTRNSGAAFSLATNATWALTLVAVVVVVVIVRMTRRIGSRAWALTLGLLLGGAVGNLIDRLLRQPGFARGHVVDFLELPHWPVFNVADSCIVVSAVLIGWLGLRGIGLDGRRTGPEPAEAAPSGAAQDRPMSG